MCQVKVQKLKRESVTRSATTKRFLAGKQTQINRYTIIAHKQNYILPYDIMHTAIRRTERIISFRGIGLRELKPYEAKLQLSIKVPLTSKPIFNESDGVYAGFTMQSW
ncbi:MAG: outer membrane phospholipase A [Pseudohongiellaceae bacterium]|jgi:outer membrane phospholipase A